MLKVALAGKPNCGKSTFFKAATLADAEVANYPFTTIKPNVGVAHVRTTCPCTKLPERCGNCVDGIRYMPVELIDVAGLVPDAHQGRGLGNAFLDDLRQAEAFIHVVDASGSTDIEGNPVGLAKHDPTEDITFLEREISYWLMGILKRSWDRLSRRISAEHLSIERTITEQMSGAGVEEKHVHKALSKLKLDENPTKWTDDDLFNLCDMLRQLSKPMMIAGNKMDITPKNLMDKITSLPYPVIPTSAEAELALMLASRSGIIRYNPGDSDFEIINQDITDTQRNALEKLRELLSMFSGTGVQQCLNSVVFDLLGYVVVYPVEDEHKLTNSDGDVLPDAFLMPPGSNAKDLAYAVHTDLGEGFLYAVDVLSGKRVGDAHELKMGDIIKVVSTR